MVVADTEGVPAGVIHSLPLRLYHRLPLSYPIKVTYTLLGLFGSSLIFETHRFGIEGRSIRFQMGRVAVPLVVRQISPLFSPTQMVSELPVAIAIVEIPQRGLISK